jgi:hypothetical protein
MLCIILSNFHIKLLLKDTEGNFRPERVESIAERFGLGKATFDHSKVPPFEEILRVDTEQTLDNVIVCRIFSHEEQMGIYAFNFYKCLDRYFRGSETNCGIA